jgi:hypothetical protein
VEEIGRDGDRCRGYGKAADILRHSFVSGEVARVQYVIAMILRGCGRARTRPEAGRYSASKPSPHGQ